jgi:cyclin-dependent kinase 10
MAANREDDAGDVLLFSPSTLESRALPQSVMFGNCRRIMDFEKINRLGEGTYGIVCKLPCSGACFCFAQLTSVTSDRARDTQSGEIVAIKRVKMDDEKEGMPISSLREVSVLRKLKHENIVQLKCVAVGRSLQSVFLVMEYCEHDLAGLVDSLACALPEPVVKCIAMQAARGVEYLHDNFLIHRDLKL